MRRSTLYNWAIASALSTVFVIHLWVYAGSITLAASGVLIGVAERYGQPEHPTGSPE